MEIKIFDLNKTEEEEIESYIAKNKKDKHYSKSDSYHFIAVITSEWQVAIDIEMKRELTKKHITSLRNFMFNENDHLNCENSLDILKMWTIKEAYSKYFQLGLYMDFRKITIMDIYQDLHIVTYSGQKTKLIKFYETSDCLVAYINNYLGVGKNRD